MAGVKQISEITETNWVMYYPELAYFLPEYEKLSSREEEAFFLDGHKRKLKVLCLYFDLILIPPEHFIRASISSSIYNDPTLRPLFEAEILVTTYWEGMSDSKCFVESLQAYLEAIGQGHVLRRPSMQELTEIKFFLRDVTGQSQLLRDTLLGFLHDNKTRIVDRYGKATYDKIESIINRSCYKDVIPFSHEKFGTLIQEAYDLPWELRKQIWDKSCSFYFNAGAVGNYCLRYPVFEIDRSLTRALNYRNIFAIFFHPDFLEMFLSALGVSKKSVKNISKLTEKQILKLRGEQTLWSSFKKTYFGMATSISSDVERIESQYNRRPGDLQDLELVRQIFRKRLLFGDLSRNYDVIETLVTVITEVLSFLTQIPLLSFVAEKAKLKDKLEDQIIRFKHGEPCQFISLLNSMLKSPS